MSSFLVCDEHITALINAARAFAQYGPFDYYTGNPRRRVQLTDAAAAQDLGTLLRETNVAGQVENYGEEEGEEENAPAYVYPGARSRLTGRQMTAVEALKALSCYEYQACEAPSWETSEAKDACDAMRSTFVRSLPGYEDAPWEWSTASV